MKSWNGLEDATAPVKPRRTPTRWRALSATFVTLVCLAAVDTIFPELKNWDLSLSLDKEPALHHAAFEWSKIAPSEHLEFHKCFGRFECAKLSLPWDYFNGTYPNHTVSIAITKIPARVPVDDARYGGPVLFNPGGPGGPGAAVAIVLGHALQQIVDSSVEISTPSIDARYFDVIGFDPRGIGWTEPVARCMPDQPASWSWKLREETEGLIGSSDAALGRLWSMKHAFGASCKLAEDQEGPDIKQYMATAFVARDMLEITEKHAEYVANEVTRKAAQKAGKRPGYYNSTYVPGKSKLQYWGFSYGTLLGSTFASMFPDRVGRLILDGVVSSYDYQNSLGNGSLTDAEKAMTSFYTFCHNLGPAECPLATTNSSVSDIEDRTQDIIASLYHNPLPIVSSDGPDYLTWSDLKLLIFGAAYQPRLMFPFVADILATIEQGGGSATDQLADMFHYNHVLFCPANGTEASDTPVPDVATTAILCGDGIDQTHLTRDEFEAYWNIMDTLSPNFGSYWSMLLMSCAAWKIKASYKFEGPYGGNTSHPILFVSNTADPVTPLRSGRYMHSLFPDSSLLISDHVGHCSISAPDICSLSRVKAYFQTGELPSSGTVCVPPPSPYSLNSTDPDSPFYDPSLGSTNVARFREMDSDGAKLLAAGEWLQKRAAASDMFGLNLPVATRINRAMQNFLKESLSGSDHAVFA
ncbi:alpha beta hydrolase fold-1 [Alternaria burnsii]|uniref:Alpha beta hydrolase fold-1 n=1 Tax=Alternaria burnsii TaxID=1187904 RepID=A0A8H7B458_9PLEO|nr:alpha beta hydrolase fold-1 [Alternaria burnsii]KAF7675003.1 alpha beta hydrolase fold-1 [Alternaria burnsii]